MTIPPFKNSNKKKTRTIRKSANQKRKTRTIRKSANQKRGKKITLRKKIGG